ncbi:hypothetical protein [Siphonobacter sp. SORGH_AS_1065]|uniref:hypothetical protein n=1 Tax=Siphonobacter sp. SORGH_AS_1065 TaxID=3041795 RepID=UPI002783DC9B|nr:hypothetical protein [Siphonobacter sp. SORGH_AS_1065]MDQ1090070.1 hypothetical protein [Siphonobacter sp. SORGH_AS_1065]
MKAFITLLLIVISSSSSFTQITLESNLKKHIDDYIGTLGNNDVLILTVEHCSNKEAKFYLSSIIKMSDFVNNVPSISFEYNNRIILYYTGVEKYIKPKVDTVLYKRLATILENNLDEKGKDARTDIPPTLYDVPVIELTVMLDGKINKKISEREFPNWSSWSNRHPVKR